MEVYEKDTEEEEFVLKQKRKIFSSTTALNGEVYMVENLLKPKLLQKCDRKEPDFIYPPPNLNSSSVDTQDETSSQRNTSFRIKDLMDARKNGFQWRRSLNIDARLKYL